MGYNVLLIGCLGLSAYRRPAVDHFVQIDGSARAVLCRGVTMAGDVDRSRSTGAFPIEGMAKLSPCQLQALKSRWMTTIDTFVAAAATEEGRAGLCKALDIELELLDDILQDARNSLGEERYRGLLAPTPGGPTGALLDEEEQHSADGSTMGDEGS